MIQAFTPESFAQHCTRLGIGHFDPAHELFVLLARFEQYYRPEDRMYLRFDKLDMEPLPISMTYEAVLEAVQQYITRPVPMMRYPTTFFQDPIFWALLDFDWYLHCNARLSEINRKRAIMAHTRKTLPLEIIFPMYMRHLKPFKTPFYGVNEGVANHSNALRAAYSRRTKDLVRVWEILTTEPAWVATALYHYHRATSVGSDAVEALRKNSALSNRFWDMVASRYDVERGRVYNDLDFEIMGVCALYHLTYAVDSEYIAELNASSAWRLSDGTTWLDYVPNLYDTEGTPRDWVLQRMRAVAADDENRIFQELHYAYNYQTERAKQILQLKDLQEDTSMTFTLLGMKNPSIGGNAVDLNDYFKNFAEFDDSEYMLSPLTDFEIENARKSLTHGEDAIPFLSELEQQRIIESVA